MTKSSQHNPYRPNRNYLSSKLIDKGYEKSVIVIVLAGNIVSGIWGWAALKYGVYAGETIAHYLNQE